MNINGGIPLNQDLKAKPYFGFIKCKVVPPEGLLHLVLPRERNGKLFFGLEPQVDTWCTLKQSYGNGLPGGENI